MQNNNYSLYFLVLLLYSILLYIQSCAFRRITGDLGYSALLKKAFIKVHLTPKFFLSYIDYLWHSGTATVFDGATIDNSFNCKADRETLN